MSCDAFSSCFSDPLQDNNLPGASIFTDISSTSIFAINLTLYILYAMLILWVVYFLFKGVVSIISADSSESFEKFRGAVTNAVFASIGLVLLINARFIFVVILNLLGVTGADNIFTDPGINTIFNP